jgi:hypothetical protein
MTPLEAVRTSTVEWRRLLAEARRFSLTPYRALWVDTAERPERDVLADATECARDVGFDLKRAGPVSFLGDATGCVAFGVGSTLKEPKNDRQKAVLGA